MSTELLVSIVTWNSAKFLDSTLKAALSAKESNRIKFIAIDNASQDNSVAIAQSHGIEVLKLKSNQGFCGGQNEGVKVFLASDSKYLCFMNPDVLVCDDTWENIFKSLEKNQKAAAVTPKLLRIKEDLTHNKPNIIDAAGMILTSSLRHLDRGSEERDLAQYDKSEFVFGGTGAFLILRRETVVSLLLPSLDGNVRPQLFDEAFFAFREDADLAWRMKGTRFKCYYDPSIIAYHVRNVTPDRRKSLSKELNSGSVRNRFLLQVNNWSIKDSFFSFINGIVFRNIIVIGAVILKEQSSIRGLTEFVSLIPRALKVRKAVKNIRKNFKCLQEN